MNSINKFFICFIFILWCSVFAQQSVWDFSVNGQLYPTGFISTLGAQKNINSKSLLGLRLGHNLVEHGNLGVQDNERGHGFGFALDYTHYLKQNFAGWYGTLRSDLWFNGINWKNNIGQANESSGHTDIVVIQPTLELGYTFIKRKNFFIRPNLAFGIELNVDTNGEDVGEGLIGLIGVSLGWRKN